MTLRFSEALRQAARAMDAAKVPASPPVRLVRDIQGRLRFAIDAFSKDYPAAARQRLEQCQTALGPYATDARAGLLFRNSFADPDAVFRHPDWHRTVVPLGHDEDGEPLGSVEVDLLDRQVTGQDWLHPPGRAEAGGPRPHRLVFFGLKGGVGRSTALAMVAWGLARQGRRVLLVDFDLESPGLSGLLLPPERVAGCGLVDWLVEDAVGQGEAVASDLVSVSPLGDTTTGAIRVAAAMGRDEDDYLAKLARVYADVPGRSGPQRMGQRLQRLLETLEQREQPDVVLIDSRAGLHDLAAVSITRLADTALLFASDGAQSWLGYHQLFTHWQRRPDVVRRVRERLAFVRALAPGRDRAGGVRAFQRRAYELFAETLYDDIPPGATDPADGMGAPADDHSGDSADDTLGAYFHPSETDEAAPHFPILVDWDERFQEFDPRLRPEQGGVTEAQIEATFGALIRWATQRVAEPGGAA